MLSIAILSSLLAPKPPLILGVDHFIFAARVGKTWKTPPMSWKGKSLATDVVTTTDISPSKTVELELGNGPSGVSLIFGYDMGAGYDEPVCRVTHGYAKRRARISELGTNHEPERLALATFATSKGAAGGPVVLDQYLVGDLNADGKLEKILVGHLGKDDQDAPTDWAGAIIQTTINGKLVTVTLDSVRRDPSQRGPFRLKVNAIADFDGDGKTELLLWETHPAEFNGTMVQFSKAGKVIKLFQNGDGD